jgi:DNA-binding FadR family transcriptional regulator
MSSDRGGSGLTTDSEHASGPSDRGRSGNGPTRRRARPRSRSPKAAELIAEEIADGILAKGLQEGDVLPNEREMTESYDVGRGTLREALRLLETQGIIWIRPGPGGGPVVRTPQPADLTSSLTLLLQFLNAPLDHVVRVREALEAQVAREAARKADPEQVAQLQANVDRTREHLDDFEVFAAETLRFHHMLSEIADNVVFEVFAESLNRITGGINAALDYPLPTRRRVCEAHQRIVDAIRDRKEQDASDCAEEHMLEFRRFVERRYPDFLARPIRWIQNSSRVTAAP